MQKKTSHHFFTKIAVVLGFTSAVALQYGVTTWATACKKPWVFFDLGNTLVAANPGEAMSYIPGAHQYLKDLKKHGFRVGLVTNVPADWGNSSKEKLNRLKKTVMEEWSHDPAADPMDWSDFSDALILLPPGQEYRKPAPYLFKAALSQVILEEGETKCRVVFQGDDPREVEVAKKEGMLGYVVSRESATPFPPIEELERLTR